MVKCIVCDGHRRHFFRPLLLWFLVSRVLGQLLLTIEEV